jgi:hypothetical protein
LWLAGALPAGAAERPATALRVTGWTADAQARLEASQLKASAEGKPAKLLRVRGPGDDLLLLALLDLAGDLTLAEPAKDALLAAAGKLPENAWAGLLRAQDGLRVALDPTPDRAALATAVKEGQVAGRAGLLEAVEPAARLGTAVIARSPVRLAVLAITDSNVYNYREDYTNPVINPSDSRDLSRRFPEALVREKTAKLAESIASYDVPVFIVHVSFLRDRVNEAYQTGLRQIAESTGGEATFCRTPGEIAPAIESAVERIAAHWSIDLELSEAPQRNFSVALEAGNGGFTYRTRYGRRK